MDASQNIDNQIAGLPDWRGHMMAAMRQAINESDPRLKEDWKWNTPVWTYKGNVCALGAFKDHIKVNFFKGAHLEDPGGLFNAGLDARDSRAIDLTEEQQVDAAAFSALIVAAADYNEA